MARSTTRDRIIEAALSLFARRGFDGTTISAIEREVGLAPGTGSFYRHFGSKEELFGTAVRHEVAAVVEANAAQRALTPESGDADAGVLQGFERVLRDARRYERLIRIYGSLGDDRSELRDEVSAALVPAIAGNWNDDPQVLVAVAAIAGYVQLRQLSGGPYDGLDDRAFLEMLMAFNRP